MRTSKDPVEIVRRFLDNPARPSRDGPRTVADYAVRRSINDKNPDLEKVLPWAGRNHGPHGFLDAHAQDIRNEEFIVKTIC